MIDIININIIFPICREWLHLPVKFETTLTSVMLEASHGKWLETAHPNCAICKADLIVGEEYCTLRCAHNFHSECIKALCQWDKSVPKKCPLCYASIREHPDPSYNPLAPQEMEGASGNPILLD